MCRFCRRIRLSTQRILAANSSPVIQALFFDSYVTRGDVVWQLLKHLGLVDLPITRGISFSPEALPHRRTIRRSFDSLPLLHSSPLATSDLTGNEQKKASLIGVEDVLQHIPLALIFQPPRPFLHHLFLHLRRLTAQNRGIYVVADLKPVDSPVTRSEVFVAHIHSEHCRLFLQEAIRQRNALCPCSGEPFVHPPWHLSLRTRTF